MGEKAKWYDGWIIGAVIFVFFGLPLIGIVKGLEWWGFDVQNAGPNLLEYIQNNSAEIVLCILVLQVFCFIGMLMTNNNTEKLLNSSSNDVRLRKMQDSISTLSYEVSRLRQELKDAELCDPKPIDISNLSQEEQQWMLNNLGKKKG